MTILISSLCRPMRKGVRLGKRHSPAKSGITARAEWRAIRQLPARGTEDVATVPPVMFYPPRKKAIRVLLDMDVLDWLRGKGPGYQTAINRILRERMEADIAAR